jgi:hypothetical protein
LGTGIGCYRGEVNRAAEQVCAMLASWTGVSNAGRGGVEKALDVAVYSVAAGI